MAKRESEHAFSRRRLTRRKTAQDTEDYVRQTADGNHVDLHLRLTNVTRQCPQFKDERTAAASTKSGTRAAPFPCISRRQTVESALLPIPHWTSDRRRSTIPPRRSCNGINAACVSYHLVPRPSGQSQGRPINTQVQDNLE